MSLRVYGACFSVHQWSQWRNFKFWAPRKETNWALLFLVPTTRPTTATYHHNTNTSGCMQTVV